MADANRRDVLKATAVAGTIAAAPAMAQTATPVLDDPQSKFTTAPFPEQLQKWPALQRDMKPVPDSGERSYRGSGRLRGRKALVTGGDSGIGRAVAELAVQALGQILAVLFLHDIVADAVGDLTDPRLQRRTALGG